MFTISAIDADRFWAAVAKGDGCWEWKRSCGKGGYGQIMVAGIPWRAHRLSWAISHGEIPSVHVLHHCDNRKCVRPDHLFLGTDLDNVRDMERKGRANHPRGEKHGVARLNEQAVREMRKQHAAGASIANIARNFGVHFDTARAVILKRTWKHVID